MTGIFEGLKVLGKKLLEGAAIETFIEYYYDQIILVIREILKDIKPEDIPTIVREKIALPIPPEIITSLKGLEGYLETMDEKRLGSWINDANPEIADALMALGDEGAEYVVRLKGFIIDSIKDTSPVQEEAETEEEHAPEDLQMIRVTCKECNEVLVLPKKEAEALEECQNCGAPPVALHT